MYTGYLSRWTLHRGGGHRLFPLSPAVAVANVLGSNIFNILVGLGLPWLLKSLVTGEPCVCEPSASPPRGLRAALPCAVCHARRVCVRCCARARR